MEGLIQLVADSFIRHGIESPDAGDPPVPPVVRPAEPILTTALPEHNYRKTLEGDPAP